MSRCCCANMSLHDIAVLDLHGRMVQHDVFVAYAVSVRTTATRVYVRASMNEDEDEYIIRYVPLALYFDCPRHGLDAPAATAVDKKPRRGVAHHADVTDPARRVSASCTLRLTSGAARIGANSLCSSRKL